MRELSDLIQYENENTALDFKSIQYRKEQNESFLKDIMSLANANTKEEKFIIIGVKHYPDGKRDFLGIREGFVDDAVYQQLIEANIEPSIGFKYYSFEFDEKMYGIFEITDCSNPPYMMKKDFGKLKLGDSFIRKGSSQNRLTRKDIDNHQSLKEQVDISNDIFVSFFEDSIIKEKRFDRFQIAMPSEEARKRIELIIIKKEREQREFEQKEDLTPLQKFIKTKNFNFNTFTKYEDRDIDTLRINLKNIKETYRNEDTYYKNEITAAKLNFYIHNNSSCFLEDVSIEALVPNSDDYYVVDSMVREPNVSFQTASWEELNYPKVQEQDLFHRICEEVGIVKHKLPQKALDVSLRLVVENSESNIDFEVMVKIFARNLKKPIEQRLRVLM